MPQLINMPPRRDVHADGAAGGAADGGAPPGLDNALIAHDRVRRTTDIPLFYGIKEKDTITPQQLIDRLERAARVARWATDELKCDQFFLSLRDEALKWSDTLDNIRASTRRIGSKSRASSWQPTLQGLRQKPCASPFKTSSRSHQRTCRRSTTGSHKPSGTRT